MTLKGPDAVGFDASASSTSYSKTNPSRDDSQGTFTRGVPDFVTGVSGGGSSPINVGSTSILEFPLNVASDDIAAGNHGHYIMFYIN